MGGPQAHVNSVESRALTHLESIGLGNAAFISMGGPPGPCVTHNLVNVQLSLA